MSKKNVLRKTYANFSATGKVRFNKDDGFQINVQSKNNPNYIYSRLTLHVDCGQERLSFAQLIGGYDITNPLPIRAFGKDEKGNTDFEKLLEISWEDRLDEDVLKEVSDYSLITVGLAKGINAKGEEFLVFKKFLSAYDAIEYIQEHLVDGSVVRVKGNIDFNEYNNKASAQKTIRSIYLSNASEDRFGATFRQQILLDKHSIGQKGENGLIPLHGYVINYDRGLKENVALPYNIYIDPAQYKNWGAVAKLLKPAKDNQVLVWGIEGTFKILTETVQATFDDLSPDLQNLIQIGMLNEEDALARAVGSNRSEEIVLFKSFATKKNSDGVDVFDLNGGLYTIDDIVTKQDLAVEDKIKYNDNPSKSNNVNPFAELAKESKVSDDTDFEDFLAGFDIE